MEFELDPAGRTAEGERYYVYAASRGKKRCIGQVVRSERSGLWSAYADGELLSCASTSEEAALKLWTFESARRPEGDGSRKPIWECTVEERFARLRRKIPKEAHFSDRIVEDVRRVPLERRARLLQDVSELIGDMETQLLWWRKVKKELTVAPKLSRYK
ncbi:MAG TPA: hypothetical protein VEZ72_12685 [Paenibacillus sp.]|nr:hypothetical protein [Paenibacillus sp.]